MGDRKPEFPFHGTPPAVTDGDRIEARCPFGRWFPAIARSAPRYDHEGAQPSLLSVHLTVLVDTGRSVLNYPAEDVRPATGEVDRAQ